MRTFYHLLANTLLASLTNFTVWFAITFFAFLETQSVLATGIISGIYVALASASGFWLGSIVDHHKKKPVMIISSVISLVAYAVAFVLYITAADGAFTSVSHISLWLLIFILTIGVIAGNIRSIALSTLVTLLISEDRRDKANGLVGTVTGISFLAVSMISGVLVGHSGMFLVLILAVVALLIVIGHLLVISIPGDRATQTADDSQKIDIKGTYRLVRSLPGLLPLIIFATFNNLLGGVFMALMDAYGLSLVSVESWGFLWGFLSIGMIISGILVARFGLGKKPLRALLIANLVCWTMSSVFTLHASIILLSVGIFMWLFLAPIAEAAEQTVLQKVVPQERQGRVFGFAQSIEQAASPLTAFLIGPLTQFVFIPFMSDGAGARLIGGWFGTGPSRGIALVFTLAGIIGLVLTIAALFSRSYKRLSETYARDTH